MRFQAWSLPLPLRHAGIQVLGGGDPGLEIEAPLMDADAAGALLAHLRAARSALLELPAREVAAVLGEVGARFLDPADELRRDALELLPASGHISSAMARSVLDGMAADWRTPELLALLDTELGGGAVLDGLVSESALAGSLRGRARRRTRALGAPLTVHVCAGTVPGVSVTSLIRALLVKSAVLLKPGRGDEVLPVLFCRALAEASPRLAGAAAVVYWKGGGGDAIERMALSEADLLVVYGGEESIARVRAAARATTPVVAYPHRLGIAVIAGAALDASGRGTSPATGSGDRGRGHRSSLESTAAAAARAVALFDQRGCVSPHLFFVLGEETHATRFAAAAAEALEGIERELPAGPLAEGEAARLQQLRGTAEMERAVRGGRVWSGGASPWTVVLGAGAELEAWPGRVTRVVPVRSVEEVLRIVGPFRRHLQTVGVAGLDPDALHRLAEGLARLGAARVAPLEAAPWPPPWWHHDGLGPLRALVRWTDVEEGSEPG
jgi:hypothetical protein